MGNRLILFFLLTVAWAYPKSQTPMGWDYGNANGILENETFLTTFMKGDQLYLNIPDHLMDVPMLLVVYGNKRHSYIHVVWSLHRDMILLKQPRIESTAGISLPFKKGIHFEENLLAKFPVEELSIGQDGSCINITDLVLKQDLEWPQHLGVSLGSPVPQISLVMGSKNFYDEVIVKVLRGQLKGGAKVAEPMFFGICALPDPMKGRRFDYRMGFYGEEPTRAHFQKWNIIGNITRWRLEKKHKNREVSDPIKPITFILSPDIPPKWKPYIKAGIEEWSNAFESAGFSNALMVKERDSLDEWQAHSIHTNVVHWSPEKYLRGTEYEDFGGTIAKVIDSRTGEILRGDIYLGASERTISERYFVRAAPLDKRAQQFPFPDELVGSLFQVLTAHEAGHIFGLMDANFGEGTYPYDKMSDSLWLLTMGYTPSIMNYTRANNIPQPSDSIPPNLLVQKVGPTDRYNIQWAYKEFHEGIPWESEAESLEEVVRWQDSVPWYRFTINQLEELGPAASNEVVETDNPVLSTELALKNLERVIGMLPEVTKDQNDNARLERLYAKTIDLWDDHMKHVLTVIGGYDIQHQSLNQPGNQYTPIPKDSQRKALDFLLHHAFDAPKWLTEPDFLVPTRYSTYPDKVLQCQKRLLKQLVTSRRFKRLEYMEGITRNKDILSELLTQLQAGLFQELKTGAETVDRRRQGLQMTYIDGLVRALEQEKSDIGADEEFITHTDYIKGHLIEHLINLKKDIERETHKGHGRAANGHWNRCLKKIESIV